MKVVVLFFAGARDLAQRDEWPMNIPDNVVTVGDFKQHIGGVVPGLDERMDAIRIARNEAFAKDDEHLADGDTLALIPPVSGG